MRRQIVWATAMAAIGCTGGTGVSIQKDGGPDLLPEEIPPDLSAETSIPDAWDLGIDQRLPDVLPEVPVDTEPQCMPGQGCFLDPCTDNKQCLSGLCVAHLGDSVCTVECVEECPAGWECRPVQTSTDTLFMCLSKFGNLCLPCMETKDCVTFSDSGEHCVSYGLDGSFCGGACSADLDCPEGFSCADTLTVGSEHVKQCTSATGTCGCTPKAIAAELKTSCTIENELGACIGERGCSENGLTQCDAQVPATDECNGLDDDCDGIVDPVSCDDGDPCTLDHCDGVAGCMHDPVTGTLCDDGSLCTEQDYCKEGLCSGAAVSCDDFNLCTDDSCVDESGCMYEFNGVPCDDQDPCTVGDHCTDGSCTAAPVDCDCLTDADCIQLDNGDLCDGTLFCDKSSVPFSCAVVPGSTVDCPPVEGLAKYCKQAVCDPDTGLCEVVAHNEGGVCDDGDACSLGDHCAKGACLSSVQTNCNDANPCTKDLCDPDFGCFFEPTPGPCSDGNSCTAPDECLDGLCGPGPAVSCDDFNPCTADNCAPAFGCTHSPVAAECNDGNACTLNDYCSNGACTSKGAPNCDDSNVCTDDACLPEWGCKTFPNSAPCDDKNACTLGDTCSDSECAPGKEMDCDDGNPCTDDLCLPASGCVHSANNAACTDGDPCTVTDKCFQGSCVGSGPLNCDDANPCTTDVCVPKAGCDSSPNSYACDDGNPCTLSDKCIAGACVPGAPLKCDDKNICSDDSCDPASGCTFTPNVAPCNDANACTITDVCSDGACVGTGAKDCNDSNVCTNEYCDPKAGCIVSVNTSPCDDGNLCTTADQCTNGACVGGKPLPCSDGNPCTLDGCVPVSGCTFVPSDGQCDDGNACTSGDHCSGGACVGSQLVQCDDGNPCTTDTCDLQGGCVSTPNTTPCDDGNPCTTQDTCAGGSCNGGPALPCMDGNGCTDDECDPVSGCTFVPNAAPCNDGDACTSGDVCANGSCTGPTPVPCSDGNACTDDSCNPATGCVFTPKSPCCGNGAVEGGEQCDDGNSNNNDACNNQCQWGGGVCPSPSVSEGNYCWIASLNCNESHSAACARAGKSATSNEINCGWSQSMANSIAAKLGKSVYKGCCANTMFCGPGGTCRVDNYSDPYHNWSGCVDGIPPLYSCSK